MEKKALHRNIEHIKALIKTERIKEPGTSLVHELLEWWKVSADDKYSEYRISNGHVIVKMPSENKKWLKFHGGQYHLRFYLCCKKNLEAY